MDDIIYYIKTYEGLRKNNRLRFFGNLAYFMVLGATNCPHLLDPALRRTGRFDQEIALEIPTEAARHDIFEVGLVLL
jgi:SpoVK/Ycf46/Vps4 family AAA+-type ATPase